MITHNLFSKVVELKEKFAHFFKHRKKILALENYSQVVSFHHTHYLFLIKRCMKDGFLGSQETDFLNHMVEKYFVDYHFLDWTHKTPWLKQEMKHLRREKVKKQPQQLDLLDLEKLRKPNVPAVPVEMINKSKAAAFFRRGP